jgi:enoyl-[acyl-carrier protein] reductase III
MKTTTINWALILGGSSGLGLASARKLAKEGYNVCIVHRNSREEMKQINGSFDEIRQHNGQFLSYNADASNPEKIKDIVTDLREKIGEGMLKCVVHSIARGNLKAMLDDTGSELQKNDFMITLDYMALSLYEWVKCIFKASLFAPDARVISFTSSGNKKAYKGYAAVSAAKVALEAITRNIALEFAPHGIRANCIQAGVTDTASFRMIPGSDQMRESALSANPFKRITIPEDIANVVYLLCRDEAAWINGVILPVDGGESLG